MMEIGSLGIFSCFFEALCRLVIKHFILFYSILFIYLYMAPLAVKANQLIRGASNAISPRKMKGLKKARSRGKQARKNLITGFYRETILETERRTARR